MPNAVAKTSKKAKTASAALIKIARLLARQAAHEWATPPNKLISQEPDAASEEPQK